MSNNKRDELAKAYAEMRFPIAKWVGSGSSDRVNSYHDFSKGYDARDEEVKRLKDENQFLHQRRGCLVIERDRSRKWITKHASKLISAVLVCGTEMMQKDALLASGDLENALIKLSGEHESGGAGG